MISFLVVLVSSQAMISTCCKASAARGLKSPKFPIGVDTIFSTISPYFYETMFRWKDNYIAFTCRPLICLICEELPVSRTEIEFCTFSWHHYNGLLWQTVRLNPFFAGVWSRDTGQSVSKNRDNNKMVILFFIYFNHTYKTN